MGVPDPMNSSDQPAPDWTDRLADWIAARWRWLVAGVVFLFVLNNFAGLMAGAFGLIAFANRIAGKVLSAQRVVRQVQDVVGESEESPPE